MSYHLLASLLLGVLGLGLWCIRNDRWWVASSISVACALLGPFAAYMTERV